MILSALLLAATCTPLRTCTGPTDTNCATPTPTLKWTAPTVSDMAGHILYRYLDNGSYTPIGVFPCEWSVSEDDGSETRFCRGADLDVAVQRYGDWPANTTQQFKVAAYDTSGNISALSSSITVCMSPICTAPGPCQ